MMENTQFAQTSTSDADLKVYILQCLLVVGFIIIAYVLQGLLPPFIRDETPLSFYFLVIVVSTWMGGFRQGMLATGCAALLHLWGPNAINNPPEQPNYGGLIQLIMFILEGSLISFIIYRLRLTRKRLFQSLQENQNRFAIALEHANISVYTNDRNLTYTWIINPHQDFTREQIIGKRDEDLLPVESVELLVDLKRTVLETGIGKQRRIATMINNKPATFSVTVEPVHTTEGEIRELVVATMDITEIEAIESALQDSRNLQNLVLDALEIGTWSIEMTDENIFWDKKAHHIFGVKLDEVLTLEKAFGIIHKDDTARAQEAYQKAIAKDSPGVYDIEKRIIWSDGSVHWVSTRGQVLYNSETQEPERLIGIVVDITRHKQIQEQLRLSEDRYHNLFNSIDEGFAICEIVLDDSDQPIDYRFLEVNDQFEEHTDLHEAAGKTALELVPELETHWIKTYGAVALERQPNRFVQKSDVMGRWFDVYAFPIGQPTDRQFAIIFKDITANKQAEEKLRESDAWLRRAKNAAEIGIYDYDVDTNTILWDQRTRELWGVGEDEHLTYDTFLEGIHPEDRDYTDAEVQKSLDPNGTGEYYVEYRVINRIDGITRWILAIGQAIFDEERAIKLVGTVQDVTERKLTEQRNLLLQRLVVALSRAMVQKEVADIVVKHIATNLETSSCAIITQIDDHHLQVLSQHGYDPSLIEKWTPVSIANETAPVAYAVRERCPIWMRSPEERQSLFNTKPKLTPHQQKSWAVLPFNINDTLHGALVFGFDETREFRESERVFMMTLTGYTAQALRRAKLTEQIEELAKLEERQRLSRDLHDSVQQILFASASRAEVLPRLWSQDPERAKQYTDDVVTLNRAALAEMRSLLLEMRPDAIAKTSLKVLIENLSNGLHGHMDVETDIIYEGPDELHLKEPAHVEIYRLTQEVFNNIVKHSHADRVNVVVRYADNHFSLTIKDDGIGFDVSGTSSGFGLNTIQERANKIGATAVIESEPHHGTEILIEWRPTTDEETNAKNKFA